MSLWADFSVPVDVKQGGDGIIVVMTASRVVDGQSNLSILPIQNLYGQLYS